MKNLDTGRVEITSQNHGFAVQGTEESIPGAPALQVTHVNLNDQTVEGLARRVVEPAGWDMVGQSLAAGAIDAPADRVPQSVGGGPLQLVTYRPLFSGPPPLFYSPNPLPPICLRQDVKVFALVSFRRPEWPILRLPASSLNAT